MENIELLVEALKKEGLRFTEQRKFIWDEITSSDDHREAEAKPNKSNQLTD